jgi:hypothetical protein
VLQRRGKRRLLAACGFEPRHVFAVRAPRKRREEKVSKILLNAYTPPASPSAAPAESQQPDPS